MTSMDATVDDGTRGDGTRDDGRTDGTTDDTRYGTTYGTTTDDTTSDDTTSDRTTSAEETPGYGGASATSETETRDHADSAAERLGGPSEHEHDLETARADHQGRDENVLDQGNTATSERADTHQGTAAAERAALIAPDRAASYNSRWDDLKGQFVDEPRGAVRGANELVGEVLDELEELFRRQRSELEHGLDNEETSTEDLRQALGRYRSFFDRLLSL